MNQLKWFILAILFAPICLTLAASPINLRLQWDNYENPLGTRDITATMLGECKIGTGALVPVGTTSSANSILDFTVSVNPGDVVTCDVFATENSLTSPRSEVAVFTVPFQVPIAPRGVRLVAR